MKKRFISLFAAFLLIVLMLGLVSCASGRVSQNYSDYEENVGDPSTQVVVKPDGAISLSDGSKIIKMATVDAETKDYAKDIKNLEESISNIGGYISSSSVRENTSYRGEEIERYANYVIKVPSDKFDKFISDLSNIFNVVSMSTSTEDVSESYLTLQARISTLEAKREGLVSMLQKTDVNTDFATWQKINAELTELDTQLAVYTEQLNALENKVAYSTVTLYVYEVDLYGDSIENGYGEAVADAFEESFSSVEYFFKEAFLFLIHVLPFIFIWLGIVVVTVIVCVVVRKKTNKKNKKKE